MVVPFGVSVGDFIAGIRLLKGAIESFSSTRGARADFIEVRKGLAALETSLSATNQFASPLHRAAIQPILDDCKECISNFLVKVAKFELLKNPSVGPSKLGSSLRKVQWSLCEKEKVVEFKRHLTSYVLALQLQLLVFNVNAQMEMTKAVEESKVVVKGVATTMALVQEDLKSQAITVPSQLTEIRQHLQQHVGLSSDEQRDLFRLLEEAVAERKALERNMEELMRQNRTLEYHLIELKSVVLQQRNIPAQVMLRSPIILIDAFEGNRLPFHLEFIDSFEALFAVLTAKFRNRGEPAVSRIRRRMFDMNELSRQRTINFNKPWADAFRPGELVEMSMLVPATSNLLRSHCPGCHRQDSEARHENERVKCVMCPMTYRWSQRPEEHPIVLRPETSPTNRAVEEEEMSAYCRVDIIETQPEYFVNKVRKHVVWFCSECNDGPIGEWQVECQTCGHLKCSICVRKFT